MKNRKNQNAQKIEEVTEIRRKKHKGIIKAKNWTYQQI